MKSYPKSESYDGASAQQLRCTHPRNLDDTLWGALVAYGFMGAICAVAMFGLVAA